jgi:hypothetical protein
MAESFNNSEMRAVAVLCRAGAHQHRKDAGLVLLQDIPVTKKSTDAVEPQLLNLHSINESVSRPSLRSVPLHEHSRRSGGNLHAFIGLRLVVNSTSGAWHPLHRGLG